MKKEIVVVLVVLSLLFISACSTPAKNNVIKIGGSNDLQPLMKVWADQYQKVNKNVSISIVPSDDNTGINDALKGNINIVMLDRDATPDEIGQGIFYVPVVGDAVFPIVNVKNTFNVAGSQQMFQALWVNGTQIVWPNNNTVVVYTRKDGSGSSDAWARYLGSSADALKGSKVTGELGIIESVRRDVNGVGYASMSSVFDTNGNFVNGIRIVPIIIDNQLLRIGNRSQALLSMQLGLYPVPKLLFLATKDKFNNNSKDFVNWILTDGQQYITQAGYIGLSTKDLTTIKSKI